MILLTFLNAKWHQKSYQKSWKILLGRVKNRRKSRSGGVLDASCNNVGFEAASWRHLGLILAASWRHLGAILGSRIEEMSTKTDVENETILWIDFSSILKGFGSRNGSQIQRNSKKIRCEKMIAKAIDVLLFFWLTNNVKRRSSISKNL